MDAADDFELDLDLPSLTLSLTEADVDLPSLTSAADPRKRPACNDGTASKRPAKINADPKQPAVVATKLVRSKATTATKPVERKAALKQPGASHIPSFPPGQEMQVTEIQGSEVFQWAHHMVRSIVNSKIGETSGPCYDEVEIVTECTGSSAAEIAAESCVNNYNCVCGQDLQMTVTSMSDIKQSCRTVAMRACPKAHCFGDLTRILPPEALNTANEHVVEMVLDKTRS